MFFASKVNNRNSISLLKQHGYLKAICTAVKSNRVNPNLKHYKLALSKINFNEYSLLNKYFCKQYFCTLNYMSGREEAFKNRGLMKQIYSQSRVFQSKEFTMNKELQDKVIDMLKTQLVSVYRNETESTISSDSKILKNPEGFIQDARVIDDRKLFSSYDSVIIMNVIKEISMISTENDQVIGNIFAHFSERFDFATIK